MKNQEKGKGWSAKQKWAWESVMCGKGINTRQCLS